MMLTFTVPANTARLLLDTSASERDVTVTIDPGSVGLAAIAEASINAVAEGALLRDSTTRLSLGPNRQLWFFAAAKTSVGVIGTEIPSGVALMNGAVPTGAAGRGRCR